MEKASKTNVFVGPNIKPALRTAPHRPIAPFHDRLRTQGSTPRKQRFVCPTTFKEKQPITQPGTTEEVEQEPFDWNKCWYPVVVHADLEPKRPTPVKLLGRDFVLWRDVNKEWKCFEDTCPHRLAPLSEGRIEPSDGSLMCSYHGWRFQSDGECTRIPQAKDGGVSTGCKNPRSRAKAFPVKVERELVWIWPDISPSAFIDSAAKKLEGRIFEEDDKYSVGAPYMRDLPYPVDFLLENILDPAHVNFSHHGFLGAREAVRGNEARKGETSLKNELKYLFTAYTHANGTETNRKTTVTYNPPDLISYIQEYPGSCIQVRASPVSSTSARVFFYFAVPKSKNKLVNSLRAAVFRPWLFHLFQASVFDGDSVFLNKQARRARRLEQEGKGWELQYFMPTSSDAAVVAFRRWLNGNIGGGGPKLPNGNLFLQNTFEEENRRFLLDRYNSHTKHCRICMGALKNVKMFKTLAYLASVGFAAYSLVLARAFVTGSAGICLWKCVRTALGLLVSAFASNKLFKLEKQFIYTDYEHWKV